MNDYYCLNGYKENEKNKVLLVYPNVGSEAKGMSLHPPLSLLYLASYLRDYPVAIFDQRVDCLEKFHRLLEQNPICVGISTMTGIQIKHSLNLAKLVKEKGIPTIFGGVHPTILPEQTVEDPRVDYVIKGEGETAFRNLVESLLRKEKISPIVRDQVVDLKKSPQLPYELVNIENYVNSAAIEGRALPFLFSRGCPYECTFCCNPVISKRKWRAMDVDVAINQLEDLVEEYNLDSVIFWDENLSVNPRILNEFVSEINGRFKWYMQSRINSLLKYDLKFLERMGAKRFSCGIESGSPRMLKKIKKQETVEEYIQVNRMLAETGISLWYNYIVGFPDETLEDLKSTVSFATQILDENPNAINSTFAMLVPYPGTEIGSIYLEADLLPKNLEGWADFGRYNFSLGWHSQEMRKLYERVCFSSKFTGKKLLESFPEESNLKEYVEILTDKWRRFDFYDDAEWKKLTKKGWEILKSLFGDNAY